MFQTGRHSSLAGGKNVSQEGFSGLSMLGVQLCLQDAIDLRGDHRLHYLVERRAEEDVDVITYVIEP